MHPQLSRMASVFSKLPAKWFWRAGFGLILLIILATIPVWFPLLNSLAIGAVKPAPVAAAKPDPHAGHNHAGHNHAGHAESQSVALSPQARKNIGLKVGEVQITNYARSITVPAIITARPGETHHKIAAPLTGIVTGVHIVGSETVKSGDLLFNLRLTHQDLVQAQTEFLTSLGKLDVEQRELARLKKITSGVVAQKIVLERQYEIDKLEAVLKAQRNALYLHGLTEEQVEGIVRERNLIREMKVSVPFLHADASVHNEGEAKRKPATVPTKAEHSPATEADHELQSKRFVVSQLNVQTGEAVQTGQTLCILTDYSELYVEGRAFEQDADEIIRAANEERAITAYPEQQGLGSPAGLEQLEIVHVANEVERDSRALDFYVDLPNEIVRESRRGTHTFVTWRFKPGQRMQLRVPVEHWENVIVLPVDAIAQEGPETFVFVENGDHFDRKAVHVKYRDQKDAVLDHDGSIFPGETVAQNAAHQLQMAIKNKSAGPVDPHAGHHH